MWHNIKETRKVGKVTDEVVTCTFYMPTVINNYGYGFCCDWVNTLIDAKNGDSTPRTVNDWVWKTIGTPALLNEVNSKGWTVIIFSNYSRSPNYQLLQERFMEMLKDLNFAPLIYISLHPNEYSKPSRGMFDVLLRMGFKPNAASFYFGDKSGALTSDYARRLDDTDYKFAQNIGLAYYDFTEILPPNMPYIPSRDLELVITVGIQGAGKSTLANRLEQDYGYIITTRKARYANTIRKALQSGKSVVMDATNPTIANRSELIEIAQEMKARPRIVWFTRQGALYNNLRGTTEMEQVLGYSEKKVPTIALSTYKNNFQSPSEAEGAEVILNPNGVMSVADRANYEQGREQVLTQYLSADLKRLLGY